ncbi:MAG: alpha-galactosidase [Kiritimatiellae bacterium]|nr:alpha-galactosidase [Kiritimatiellia bacterium]
MNISIPRELPGIQAQSQHVTLRWKLGAPAVSFQPNDRAMRAGRQLDGWTWYQRDRREAHVPGLGTGTVTSDRFRTDGLHMAREIFLPAGGSRIAVRVILENRTGRDLHLGDWPVLEVDGAESLKLGAGPAGSWKMFRNGRYKNDHPVVVSLGGADQNLLDAAGRGSESGDLVAAGAPRRLVNDPMTVLKAGHGAGPGTLLLGFLSELEHLSYIEVLMDERRVNLAGLAAVCEFDGCLVPDGARRATAWLLLDADDNHFRAVRAYAEAVAGFHGIAPPPPPKNVYCTWYFYGRHLTDRDVQDELACFAEKPWPIDTIQIDYGWEQGWGDWVTREDWTTDVAEFSKRISGMGYEPGIWTCPFLALTDSNLAANHDEWLLRDTAGERVMFPMSGADNLVLDPTRPDVQDWLRALYSRLRREWGFTYHKFDFTRAVAMSKDAAFHDPTATRAQAYRRGFETIRAALGPDAYMLICGGLYLPSVGIANGQRSGSDVRSCWMNPRADTRIRQNLLRWWMNRLWHQDPDALMVRRRATPYRDDPADKRPLSLGLLSDEEAQTLTANQYLGGGLVCFTERMCELDAGRAALYPHCVPALGAESVPVDLFANGRIPAIHVTHVRPRAAGLEPWYTVALMNCEDAERVFDLTLDGALLIRAPEEESEVFLVWEFFERRLVGVAGWGERVRPVPVPAHGTRVLRLARWTGRAPVLLGTDRHFSMGGVEIGEWTQNGGTAEMWIQSDWPGEFSVWFALPGEALSRPRIVRKRVVNGARVRVGEG